MDPSLTTAMIFMLGMAVGGLLYPQLKEMYKKPPKKHKFFLREGRDF